MESIVVQFSKEKDTPGTRKFKEDVEAGRERGVVGSIYVLKPDLEKIGNPSTIVVTITPLGS